MPYCVILGIQIYTHSRNIFSWLFYVQFWLTLHYLMTMTEEQTLVMYSGHPLGLFPSRADCPRLIITNGMVIPNYSSRDDYDRMFALGVTM